MLQCRVKATFNHSINTNIVLQRVFFLTERELQIKIKRKKINALFCLVFFL